MGKDSPEKIKSVRLNEDMRHKIVGRLMEQRFKKSQQDLAKDFGLLGDEVYDLVYPRDVQKLMAKLPAEFFRKDDGVSVSFGGQVDRATFSKLRLVADKHRGSAVVMYFAAVHVFTKRYDELMSRKRALDAATREARAHAKATLWHATTLRQLLAAWPECRPFAEDFLRPEVAASVALAVPVAVLNKEFGLAKQEEQS